MIKQSVLKQVKKGEDEVGKALKFYIGETGDNDYCNNPIVLSLLLM